MEKKFLSKNEIDELDSLYFDQYHENICNVAIDNFKKDGEVVTILIGHNQGQAVLTEILKQDVKLEAPILMQKLDKLNCSTYSFISEGKMKFLGNKTKRPVIVISSHNKLGDSRTTIYAIESRKYKKLSLYATGEVSDNIWNYLFGSKERTIH